MGLGGGDSIQHQIHISFVESVDEHVLIAHEDHGDLTDGIVLRFRAKGGGDGTALDVIPLGDVIGAGADGGEVFRLSGLADGLPDVLGDDGDGVADGLHGGVIAGGQDQLQIPVHHIASVIIRQEISLTAQRTGVFGDVVEGELNILSGEGNTVAPGAAFCHLEPEPHPVGVGNGDLRTGQKFCFRFGNGIAAFVIAEDDILPLALLCPLLGRGIEGFIAVETAFFPGQRAFCFHQTIGEGQGIPGGVHGGVNRAVGEDVGFTIHIIRRDRGGTQQGVVEQTHKKGGGVIHRGVGIQILGQFRGAHPQGFGVLILPDTAGQGADGQRRRQTGGNKFLHGHQ